ncbi:hypothetical protein AMATHDRAFT_151509 [Amanita thiersii Skay4041]|uniref:Peptide hydrolase n=1 Tax=Amanita thiersii Skay4041 TaxID=703135 RepID=A0A2A9NHG4_9AGAR|nr:hypothetical protein AMATHDRAFT_151509 [Amanita thiersii Skay4041]
MALSAEFVRGGVPNNPPVSSESLTKTITDTNLLKHAHKLAEFANLSNGTRVFGSPGHNATVQYIKDKLDATGFYDIVLQTFPYMYSYGTAQFSVNGEPYSIRWIKYGPAGQANATLVPISNLGCNSSDFTVDVSGKIAIISRGQCDLGIKVALAGAAGASGVIIYNNVTETLQRHSLTELSRPDIGPYVPCGVISVTDGQALLQKINAGGTLTGSLTVEATTEQRYTSNVLATTKSGDQKNVVMAGGHTDSVPPGPGINDNGSGSMGILEIALQLARFNITNAVRFGFWTAEEYGGIGSNYYTSSLTTEEQQEIALYLNFDMIASPNFGYFIYDGDGSAFNLTGPSGSDAIEHVFEDYYKAVGIVTAGRELFGRSDYDSFFKLEIPFGGIDTGAEEIKSEEEASRWGGQANIAYDPCYHQSCDTVQNLNATAWVANTKAGGHAIATFARSLEGIPRPRNSTSRLALPKGQLRARGCGHEILSM